MTEREKTHRDDDAHPVPTEPNGADPNQRRSEGAHWTIDHPAGEPLPLPPDGTRPGLNNPLDARMGADSGGYRIGSLAC